MFDADQNEGRLRHKLHSTTLKLTEAEHQLNVIGFRNKTSGSITREDYIRRDKLCCSLGFVHSTLSESYLRSEENNQVLQTTDRFLVKHGIGSKCL